MQRTDWTTSVSRRGIDLSQNVHYDSVLSLEIKRIITEIQSFHDYPNQFNLYKSISLYYDITLDRLTIGYGATEVIERVFKTLKFDKVYCVEPSFQMIEVYAKMYGKKYIPITIDTLFDVQDVSAALFIANPNGNNGQAHNINGIVKRFKYVVSDEVYADFDDRFSLLYSQYENTIIIKSFSKSLGLAGFRCGFAVSTPELTYALQQARSNFIMSSFSELIIPKVIYLTPDVVYRMNETKTYLESMFKCKPSSGNYVLFSEPNKYTERFGFKLIGEYYRMALTDMKTLEEYYATS